MTSFSFPKPSLFAEFHHPPKSLAEKLKAALSIQHEEERSKILVVDNDYVSTLLLKTVLTEYNFPDVTTTTSAIEAAQIIENNHFDLAFLNIEMPQIDGFELFQRLRETNSYPPIPVVFVSACSDPLVIEKAHALGAADYLVKPFDICQLISRVKSLFQTNTAN